MINNDQYNELNRENDIEIVKTSMGYLVATEDWQEIVKTKWGIYKLIRKHYEYTRKICCNE